MSNGSENNKLIKTDAEWRAQLTPEQYAVTRQSATERPFSSPLLHEKRTGTYRCVACGTKLFSDATKYESGCGWPSFYRAASPEAVSGYDDYSHGMARVEIRCSGCDSHLGHVFEDGPPPTGLRYCMNGVALTFEPSQD